VDWRAQPGNAGSVNWERAPLPKEKRQFILVCEHACNDVPEYLHNKLPASILNSHYGYDLYAKEVTIYLAQKFKCPSVLQSISRVVIDCNRFPDHPALIPSQCGQWPIEANQRLSGTEKHFRLSQIFYPFHEQVVQSVKACQRRACRPMLIGIHTFNRHVDNQRRDWDIGILWNEFEDAKYVGEALMKAGGFHVGLNEPYSAKYLRSFTLDVDGSKNGVDSFAIEICNDIFHSTSLQSISNHISTILFKL